MTCASAENQWELSVERMVPLKRHVAYRVMVNRVADWWWCPFSSPVSKFSVAWYTGSTFQIKGKDEEILQEGTILLIRPGWFFCMTDAIRYLRPGAPSMVGHWSLRSTPKDDPDRLPNACSTFTATIRHFSEDDYLRNVALGLEQGWNESADRFVKLCEEKPVR